MGQGAVILAGGSGKRFWPLSEEKRPKQFLKIYSNKTLVEETYDRIKGIIPARNIYVVASARQLTTVKKLLKDLPDGNFIKEPEARNTAPALLLVLASICHTKSLSGLLILPADHIVRNRKAFQLQVKEAFKLIAGKENIILFGIKPSKVSSAYGYMKVSYNGKMYYKAEKFIEKPDEKKAKKLIKEKWLWNSGISVWKPETLLKTLSQVNFNVYKHYENIATAVKKKNKNRIRKEFRKLPKEAMEKMLYEKANNILVIPAKFDWTDIGSWSSMYDNMEKTKAGNVIQGKCIALVKDSENNLVIGNKENKVIALIGIKELIIVDTDKSLLICHKEKDQEVKEIARQAQENIKKRSKK